MNKRIFAMMGMAALGLTCGATLAIAQTPISAEGPGAKPGLPGWYMAGSASDPEGPFPPRPPRAAAPAAAEDQGGLPPRCTHQVICEMDGTRAGGVGPGENGAHIIWKATPGRGFTFTHPFELPAGGGVVSAMAVDSKDNVWAYQRNNPDVPALFKFGPDHKLLFAVSPQVQEHAMPSRAHGMAVDPEDNVWITDEGAQTVQKFSPDGKLLLSLGSKGKRGDWDEAKGQRLLWEPVAIGFNQKSGDAYIFEGHGDQSPTDVGSSDPTNNIGAPRVIHLDKNGKFIAQWYGNARGPGKFNNAHGGAVDPVTGDVWVGDRQDYRITVFNADGQFIRTIPTRNLVCALYFDNHPGPRLGQLWLATGQDGQIVQIDRNANVLLLAGGTRSGKTPQHFGESSYFGADSKGNLFAGDTVTVQATELIAPAQAKAKAKK